MDDWNRRAFIKTGLAFVACSLWPVQSLWAKVHSQKTHRSLAFYNMHTEEMLQIRYFENGQYVPEALSQINYILRDHRADTISKIDLNLLDLLYIIDQRISGTNTFNIISGYRTPKTNRMLGENSRGVAKKSLHTLGQAVDIRLPGYSTSRLRDMCINLKAGGVGYYPRSDFIHIDTGRVRAW